jgi:aminopeptidase
MEHKLIEPDYTAIARKIIRESAGVKRDENVTILGRTDSLEFCELLELECRRVGACPFVVVGSDAAMLRTLLDPFVPESELARPSPQLLAVLTVSDVIITTYFERANPSLFHTVDPVRWRALRQSEEAPSDIIYDGKRRWIGTEIPTPAQAQALGVEWVTLHNSFWRAMQADYRQIGEQAVWLAEQVRRAKGVRITCPQGTDLRFNIGGRPVECDDGIIGAEDLARGAVLLNLPSGEVCFAPSESSAYGNAFIEVAFWQGQAVRGLELEFIAGQCRAISAKEGLNLFVDTVENAGGDSRWLGEFGIGLNPAVTQVLGYTLLDEKMLGTVHIALGENRALGGENNSALHWDLVIQNPSVALDGIPVLLDGKLLLH